MKFYNRENEIAELEILRKQSFHGGRMVVITGRRRVGKTLLALQFSGEFKHIYFFVSKKSENLLSKEYADEIKRKFPYVVTGEISSFKNVFELMIEVARTEPCIMIVDEFQEFYNTNLALYSEIQKLWDLNKEKSRLYIIFIGSVYSLMHKIFEGAKEPLFNRADRMLILRPFSIAVLRDILADHKLNNSSLLFDYYVTTGCMPKYIDLLVQNGATSRDTMLDFIIQENSPFLNEGKSVLIDEFGRDYGAYFSILELISSGKTARSEIESILKIDVGGYLDRLERDYAVIAKHKPINAKPGSRALKYKIIDNFLNFWFRFIYRNRSAVESGNFDYVKDVIRRDYSTYSGVVLERFYHQVFSEMKKYNKIGSYWEGGNRNEIDLVAVNDMKKEIVLADIKIDKSKIDIGKLKERSLSLLAEYPEYRAEFIGLSMSDIELYLPQQKDF